MADASYTPAVYRKQGGTTLVAATGGTIQVESGGTLQVDSGATLTLPAASIVAASLGANLKTGFIPLSLADAREVSSNASINAAGNGGLLASDTTPIYERVNGATDKQVRLRWAASNVDELQWSFPYPPDLDDAGTVVVHMLAAMGGATDTPTVTVGYFEGVGDTDAGGATAAVTGTTVARYSCTIAAADVGAYPNMATVAIVPGAHTTDTFLLYGAYLTYTRKS